MVFEYMEHDLTGLLDMPGVRFTIPQIKCYLHQLLEAIALCHEQRIIHRDVKGQS